MSFARSLVNHNEFRHWNHIMKDEFHSWFYHCLYGHTDLSWNEISCIEDICIDFNLRFQYCL
jgi:hypothetical protein